MTALVAGERVVISLFADGLAGWVYAHEGTPFYGDAPWSPTFASGVKGRAVPALKETLEACREIGKGRFEVLACGGAVEQLGLTIDRLIEERQVDDVVGLPTIWRRTHTMRVLSI